MTTPERLRHYMARGPLIPDPQLIRDAATEIESLKKERDELKRQNAALVECMRALNLALGNDGVEITTNNMLSFNALALATQQADKALAAQPEVKQPQTLVREDLF